MPKSRASVSDNVITELLQEIEYDGVFSLHDRVAGTDMIVLKFEDVIVAEDRKYIRTAIEAVPEFIVVDIAWYRNTSILVTVAYNKVK